MNKNNQKGFIVQGVIAIIALILIGGGAYYAGTHRTSVAPKINESVIVDEQVNDSIEKTYTNVENGYEVSYPTRWQIETLGDSIRIVNSVRRGKDETDQPTEVVSIFLKKSTSTCKESNWEVGFAYVYYKTVCPQGNTKVAISMAAFDEQGKSIEEKILSTFKFTDQNQNIIQKNDWGISFPLLSGWKVANNVDSQIVLTQDSSGDRIIIDYTKSNIYTDIDSKFGSITYEFNDVDSTWYQIKDKESGSAQELVKATPQFYLEKTIPVFIGTSRWKTYIIAVSDNIFIKVNITGSGNTEPLEQFIKSMKIIS